MTSWNLDVYPYEKKGSCSDCGATEVTVYLSIPADIPGKCMPCERKFWDQSTKEQQEKRCMHCNSNNLQPSFGGDCGVTCLDCNQDDV